MRRNILNKKHAQDQKISKRNFSLLSKKFGQEEMVGFGLIIIVVGVILLVFVSMTLRKAAKEEIESYEVSAFIGSVLQQTTSCQKNFFYLDLQDLIFECANEGKCSNNQDACEVLENTLKSILQESWKTGGEEVTKGYDLNIEFNSRAPIIFTEGEITGNNYKGNFQDATKAGVQFTFYFTAYY